MGRVVLQTEGTLFRFTVKPYRTPPSRNIQSSATQKCCGMAFFSFFLYIFILQYSIFQLNFLRVKYFIPYYCIYRNVIPQNLNSLLRLVVAKQPFAVWFHAVSGPGDEPGDVPRGGGRAGGGRQRRRQPLFIINYF